MILPIQNPDGREAGTRRNLYGFDMNRDWFARTQPETDGKLEVVRQYPPMLYIDAHEFGLPNYFFPPNADPEYHEIPDTAHDWINGLYSPAIASQFDREKIKFFHGAPYDFFAIVFGDTVPTTGYHAAGMTFEKESSDAISVREHEHFTSMWASIAAGAAARSSVLADWHASYVEAYDEGVAGELEPNAVFEPSTTSTSRSPTSRSATTSCATTRIAPPSSSCSSAASSGWTSRSTADRRPAAGLVPPIRRPERGDDAPDRDLLDPDGTGPEALDPGDAQRGLVDPVRGHLRRHRLEQPAAHEPGRRLDGEDGRPGRDRGACSGRPAPPAKPADVPSIGLFEIPNSTRGFEAAGQARYLFDKVWGLDYTNVTAADITAGLAGIDVLVIPDGYANYGVQALGAKGKRALRDWVNAGGRLVAWQGGVEVAVKAGVSTVKLASSHTDAPGTLIRVSLDDSSPLAAGIGDRDWVMYQDDRTMQPGLGTSVATFPAAGNPTTRRPGSRSGSTGSPARRRSSTRASGTAARSCSRSIRTSGHGRRARSGCSGTRSRAGSGRRGLAPAAGSRERAAAEKAAADAVATVPDLGSAIRIRVAAADAAATAKILQRHGGRSSAGPRRRHALPGGQPGRPVVRGASVVRADRPRPGQGRAGPEGGQPAVAGLCRACHACAACPDHRPLDRRSKAALP